MGRAAVLSMWVVPIKNLLNPLCRCQTLLVEAVWGGISLRGKARLVLIEDDLCVGIETLSSKLSVLTSTKRGLSLMTSADAMPTRIKHCTKGTKSM